MLEIKSKAYYRDHMEEYARTVAEPVMNWVDRLPLEWRLLVHEYGTKAVRRAIQNKRTPRYFKALMEQERRAKNHEKYLTTFELEL